MNASTAIPQRIKDFRGFCASNRITYKEVTDAAGLNYESVIQNMRHNMLSDERMTLLEKTAKQLAKTKMRNHTS